MDEETKETTKIDTEAMKEQVKKKTISEMKKLAVYKKEYNRVIEIYSELVVQYDILTKQFENSNFEYEIETMQGGKKKAPIVATLEILRKDILSYSDRLFLNPKSQPTNMGKGKGKSKLAAAISRLQ